MTSLQVICGLGPPNQKSWLRLWLGEMLIEQIIEVESRVPGFLVVHIPKTSSFHDKTKIFKSKTSSELFNAKNVAESNVP